MRGKRQSAEERFWQFVRVTGPDECWLWTGSKSAEGYGKFSYGRIPKTGRYMSGLAHRFSYTLHKGVIASDMFVCHRCDTPSCVNPNHLFLGTNQDNMKDCAAKGRNRSIYRGVTHCIHGHPFDTKNTIIRGGKRKCRTCNRISALKAYHLKKDRTHV